MYLKKLDIKGFKSFADTTEIAFYPGINVIVGPNGCGKSNIVDALRWVLGESNVRNIRGQRNEDVIFSGTDQKRALGMANVAMIIDNADGQLPVEYTEVAVGRKLFRNGESEFFINKSRVRLKDIGSLFTGTGLGKRGYSIIGQGELEQVLNGQPLDRRLILEEASGIIKYRQQRDEVLARMEATGNDMEKLEEHLFALGERREELRDKAGKARTYIQARDSLHKAQQDILEYESGETLRRFQEKCVELEKSRSIETELRESVENLQRNQGGGEARQEQLREKSSVLREKRHEIEKSSNAMEAEIRLRKEREENASRRLEAISEDRLRYQRMLQKALSDAAMLEGELAEARAGLDKLCREASGIESEQGSGLAMVDEREKEYADRSDRMHIEQEKQKEAAAQLEQLRNRLSEVQETGRQAVFYHAQALNRENDLKEQRGALRSERDENDKGIESLNAQLANREQDRKQLQQELQASESALKEALRRRAELNGRWSHLNDQDRNYEGYSGDVRNVLQAYEKNQQPLPGLVGLLGSLIEVPPGLETAIDVAGGRSLGDIVVESELDARRAINYIKEKRLGRVTFLPLDILKTQPLPPEIEKRALAMPGVLGIASRLLQYDPRYQKAVDYLFGRVLIVENLERAVDVFRNLNYSLRIVSLEGEILNTSGAMTGGSSQKTRQSPLVRQAEKRRLESELGVLNSAIEGLQSEQSDLEKRQQLLKTDLERLNSERNILQSRNRVYIEELGRMQAESETCRLEAEKQQKLIDEWKNQADCLEEKIYLLKASQEARQKQHDEERSEVEKLGRLVDELRRSLAVRNERLDSYQQQIQMKQKEIVQLESARQQQLALQESQSKALNGLDTQEEQYQTDIARFASECVEIEGRLDSLKQELTETDRELAEMMSAEKQGLEAMQEYRAQLISRRQDLQERETATRSLEMARVRLEAELEALSARWTEQLGKNMPAQPSSPYSAREIREMRVAAREWQERLESIGSVDIDSIAGFEEINARYEFVNEQYSDLVEARHGLLRLLKETENIMAREFGTFREAADASFSRTFKEIFGGGEASLELTENSNPLMEGIEMMVKLPGKKIQPLNLLSGGERALTCIAFIFALLRLKPAPFCLLDEIDAALDENNLLKFTRFLQKLAGSIQFLVITHRQPTIEAGDIIYGVTMPQAGISSIYSLNLNEAAEMAG